MRRPHPSQPVPQIRSLKLRLQYFCSFNGPLSCLSNTPSFLVTGRSGSQWDFVSMYCSKVLSNINQSPNDNVKRNASTSAAFCIYTFMRHPPLPSSIQRPTQHRHNAVHHRRRNEHGAPAVAAKVPVERLARVGVLVFKSLWASGREFECLLTRAGE